ncbi:MAG: efflux RND transporter periplasmic adaptor subunit [Zoogloeaceae bacterium]|nr:efflux RND transporter periplasmic adaptor subunit [Zoogloeaceae bacterium]
MMHNRPLDVMRRAVVALALVVVSGSSVAQADSPRTEVVERGGGPLRYAAEARVEAVRATVVAAQVPGRVTALNVKAGDWVRTGQVLATIDERAAQQQVAASEAQAAAAQAQLEAARREYERQQRLFKKDYLSQAALDRAEAQFKAASAEARASLAQSGVARTQSGFHTLAAPYAGVVAAVSVELGDMAMPGKPLFELYDPGHLRVTAHVPEALARRVESGRGAEVELPAGSEMRRLAVPQFTILPTADPQTHTVELRLPLPTEVDGLVPGQFARALLPLIADTEGAGLTIPAAAVIRRTELNAVYVLDARGKPQLRQVRLGRRVGERVEVLAGLAAGEAVVLEPLAAVRP